MKFAMFCFAASLCVAQAALPDDHSAGHLFRMWGGMSQFEKAYLYWGWLEGTATNTLEDWWLPFATCLSDLGTRKAIATIDGFYVSHEESRSVTPGLAFQQALTGRGAPCEATPIPPPQKKQ